MPPSQPIRYKDLYIPQPCAENWEGMNATERGRFCQSCQKEVIDFTFKTERELNAILASGEWTGCGRFVEKQLGKAPVVESPLVQMRRAILERWRSGAAAAVLLVGLWQIPNSTKATAKEVVCLVPTMNQERDSTKEQGPNYFVSAILLSEYGEPLPRDFWINLHLPSGELIPILTHNGFFGIDLEGKAMPEDSILITVPPLELEDSAFKLKIEFSEFRFRLADGQNLQKTIHAIFLDKLRGIGSIQGGPMGISDKLNPSNVELLQIAVRKEEEPLFKTKTPEERAEARAAREARKSGSNRP
jgi:hypothetical protein